MSSEESKKTDIFNSYNCSPNYISYNSCNYNSLDSTIIEICRYNYHDFLKKANVVGIGLGYKTIKGYNTFEKCIKVFVSEKLPYYKLKSVDLIPSFYKGFKTDVIETGTFKVLSQREKIRPTQGGFSIGPMDEKFIGTLSCLVTDDTSTFILGNNHVLAGENTIPTGTPILQPGTVDGGNPAEDIVALLSRFIHLKFQTPDETPENEVDCALAKVDYKYFVSPEIAFIGLPQGTASPQLSMPVQRIGRTTNCVNCLIDSVGATIIVEFSFGQRALFINQIVTTEISEPGDSGALLFDDYKKIIGLLCGGSKLRTFYNPIETILSYLGVKLVMK